MSYVKKTVSTTTSELTFIKTFINALTTTDERIICESDETTIQKFITNNGTPIFIKINNSCEIKIKRTTGYNSYATDGYQFTIMINNNGYNATILKFSSSMYSYDAIFTRTLNFSVASNDNAIFISIGNHDNNTIGSSNFFILCVDYDNFTAVGSSTSFSSLNTLYCTDLVNTNQTIKLINRLAYQDGGNDITNTIDSKVFTYASSNTKFAEVATGLMDCSYMTSPSVISTNSGKFFTLNNYTLIPIKE